MPVAERIERSAVFGMPDLAPCQPQRPTTGCPQPIPGSRSHFPACDRETGDAKSCTASCR
jgi:hypothetical protein